MIRKYDGMVIDLLRIMEEISIPVDHSPTNLMNFWWRSPILAQALQTHKIAIIPTIPWTAKTVICLEDSEIVKTFIIAILYLILRTA